MKRLAFISTALLLSVSLAGGISANAAAAETQYPENGDFTSTLEFSSLKDYAVSDGAFAFVDGNTVKVYEVGTLDESGEKPVYKNGSLTEYGDFEVTVTSIDCVNGSFYYSDGNGKVYSLSDKSEAEGVTLTQSKNLLLNEATGYTYTIVEAGITVYKAEVGETKINGTFSGLKKYGDYIYAISGNELCKFSEADMQTAEMQYVDYSPAKNISVGNTAEILKNYTLRFVTVASGAYMTEVDLSSALTDKFKTGETAEILEDAPALLLGYSGNAALVSIGKQSYITLKTNVTEDEGDYFTDAEFTKAQLLGDAIYASPFVMECGYALYRGNDTVIVDVKRKLKSDVLEADFYEVSYTDKEGKTVTGYVISGLLSGDNVDDDKQPTEKPDANHTEKNNVKTVLIVLMVVILVLIVISYLLWLVTGGKRGKTKSTDK
ncbi:MAG: hypothetical protein K2N22_06100 [Clostridia bacterium]|nr:hypothetical protein [Clostridia bacterium]